jgi:hypothetical protein
MGMFMSRSSTTRAFLLSAALLAATSSGGASRSVSNIEVTQRASANASLAVSGRFAAIAWGASTKDGVMDVFLATSRDGGRAFAAPTRVNENPGAANLSGEQPPRVALIPRPGHDPSVVVVWTAKTPSGTRLWSARSSDGGKSFAAPTLVPGSDAPGNRGWESITVRGDGKIAALWLDHRELASASGASASANHSKHKHGSSSGASSDGTARAQLSKLFFGRLDDPAGARALSGGVCYCCKTTMATGSDGAIYAAWRHVYPGSIRDIAFAMSKDGGRTFSTPVRVSEDNWVLDGCPENGPALAVDGKQRIHVVWPTLVAGAAGSDQTLALFYATSPDGQHFTPRQRIPTEGAARQPQVTVGPRGEVVVSWDEQSGGTRRVSVARGTPDANGAVRFERKVISDAGSNSYPVVGTVDNGTIVAWTNGSNGQSVIRVERLER